MDRLLSKFVYNEIQEKCCTSVHCVYIYISLTFCLDYRIQVSPMVHQSIDKMQVPVHDLSSYRMFHYLEQNTTSL